MRTYYETIVDDNGDWDCYLILINGNGNIENIVYESTSDIRRNLPYLNSTVRGEWLRDSKSWTTKHNQQSVYDGSIFYLITDTPCTGERSWFALVCRDNGIEDYRMFRACWEPK